MTTFGSQIGNLHIITFFFSDLLANVIFVFLRHDPID